MARRCNGSVRALKGLARPPASGSQVSWRRLSLDTYVAFLVRVMGWPHELASQLPRTKAVGLIVRALVRGLDPATVPKPPPRF